MFSNTSYSFVSNSTSSGTAQGHIVVNASYGSGSYSYAFSKVSGYGSINSTSGNSATVSFTHTGTYNDFYGTFQCVITDTVYGATQTISCQVEFYCGTGTPP